MKRTRINPKGKKGKQWDTIKEILIPWFLNAGFDYCELRYPGCWGQGFFAHAKTRPNCNENDLYVVAHLCNNCHNKIETKDEEMEKIILSIRARNHVPELDSFLENYSTLKDSRGY